MPSNLPNRNPLSYLGVKSETPPDLIQAKRDPNGGDTQYQLGTIWLNKVTKRLFALMDVTSGTATWDPYAGASTSIDTLTGDTGGAISPIAGNINLVGSGQAQLAGSAGTLTLTTTTAGFPVTPFVVGPAGDAGYNSVTTAVAAVGATDSVIYHQPGGSFENITISNNFNMVGATASPLDDITELGGVHTVSADVSITIRNMKLSSATDILTGAFAGTKKIVFVNCVFDVTNGYVVNLPNWLGEVVFQNCISIGTNDGICNTLGPISLQDSVLGAGLTNLFNINSSAKLNNSTINAPVVVTGSANRWDYMELNKTVSINTPGQIVARNCLFNSEVTTAINYNTTGNSFLINCIINTVTNPSVSGVGPGLFALSETIFSLDTNIAGTVPNSIQGTTRQETLEADKLDLFQIGSQIQIAEGVNASMGTATLVAGTVLVNNTLITANTRVFLTRQVAGAAPGELSLGVVTPGTSFTITSTNGADTGTIAWLLIEPS